MLERLAPGSVLSSERGPLTVVSSRPLSGERGRYLVQFDGVADRVGAERLRGVDLTAEALDLPGALWVHELVGASVRDASSGAELGRISAVEANPASDLLVLESGVLIPRDSCFGWRRVTWLVWSRSNFPMGCWSCEGGGVRAVV